MHHDAPRSPAPSGAPSTPSLLHQARSVGALVAALGTVGLAACGGGERVPPAQVAELASMSGSAVAGQATASSRRGEVRISVAVHGLAGPSTLRMAVLPGACPEDSGPVRPDLDADGDTPAPDPGAGALARLQVSTEGTSGAGTLLFPAADLPEGGDVAIVVRDFTGTVLACGQATGLPVTELPEGAEPPVPTDLGPQGAPAPGEPPAPDSAAAVDGGVSA